LKTRRGGLRNAEPARNAVILLLVAAAHWPTASFYHLEELAGLKMQAQPQRLAQPIRSCRASMRPLVGAGACFGVLKPAHPIMKTKLILLPLVLASLCLSSCVSYAYTLGSGWSDSPASKCQRIGAGAIDLVTLPVQLPVIARAYA